MAELLKKMSEINAVSGNENDIRNLIIAEIKDKVDDITIDTMGNVIAYKKGSDSGKKIAVAVNMDEPGFIISGVTEKGYLKFKAVGNIDPRKIISKRVVIGADKIKGVIGMKAIHLQTGQSPNVKMLWQFQSCLLTSVQRTKRMRKSTLNSAIM